VQAGRLQRELIELQSELFSNMDAQYWNHSTNKLAIEMMRSTKEKTAIRYSEKLYYFAFILSTYSATAYQLLRKVIPLPSLEALYSKVKNILKEREDQLSRVNHPHLLSSDLLKMDERAQPAVIIGVGAISVCNTFVGMSRVIQEKEKYMFLLNLRPIFPESHCRPIRVVGSETGNVNESFQRRIDEIVACSREARIFVLGIASDGDPSYNPRHEKFFNFWRIAEKHNGVTPDCPYPDLSRATSHRRLAASREKLALTDDQISTGSRLFRTSRGQNINMLACNQWSKHWDQYFL
jgi:hypothetical protein